MRERTDLYRDDIVDRPRSPRRYKDKTMAAATSSSSSSAAIDDTDASLASTIFARLHPATYLHRFLSASLRPDGRAFDEVREARIGAATIEVAQGSCVVRHGNTMMVAGVRAELLDVSDEDEGREGDDDDVDANDEYEEQEVQGTTQQSTARRVQRRRQRTGLGPVDRKRVVVGVDLGPMASPRFKPGPPGVEAQLLASRLQRTLEVCPPLEASDLVIEDRLMSWCLYVDLVCIAYDGNAFDAALLAINGALQDTRLPQTTFDPRREQYVSSHDAAQASALQLRACPLSLCFAIVDGGYLLADPNAFEATLAQGSIRVTIDAARLGKRRDIVDVEAIGRCEACVSVRLAKDAGLQAGEMEPVQKGETGASGDDEPQVRVRDECLVKMCIERARRHVALRKEVLLSAQRPVDIDGRHDVDMA